MNTIKTLRTEVFQQTQTEFARLGNVSQSSVAKWERDVGKPDIEFVSLIRAEAIRLDLPWDDRLIFQDHDGIKKTVASILNGRKSDADFEEAEAAEYAAHEARLEVRRQNKEKKRLAAIGGGDSPSVDFHQDDEDEDEDA